MDYPRQNMLTLIHDAIKDREKIEREWRGPNFESAILAGWRAVLKAVQAGEQIHLKD